MPEKKNLYDAVYGQKEKEKKEFKMLDRKFDFVMKMEPTTVLVGREREKRALRIALSKSRMRNAIILGEAGVGKTELVRAIADESKEDFVFYEVSSMALVSGTMYRGTFEEKIVKLLNAVKAEQKHIGKPIVLFFDEMHLMIGCGSTMSSRGSADSIDLSNMLKPYLSNGTIIVWGATTTEEYDIFIKAESAFCRRFAKMKLGELGEEETKTVLRNFAKSASSASDDVAGWIAEEVYKASEKKEGHQPDKSIELMDQTLAILKTDKKPFSRTNVADAISEANDVFGLSE